MAAIDSTFESGQSDSPSENADGVIVTDGSDDNNFTENAGHNEAGQNAAQETQLFPLAATLAIGDLRKFRLRHEEFVQALASRLSLYFRLECSLQISKLEVATFKDLVAGIKNPTHVSLFKLDPFKGICLLNVPLPLALCLVERELGGLARAQDEIRELSKVEARVIGRVTEMLMGEWCAVWRDLQEVRPSLLRTESSGRFLLTHAPQTPMLVLGIEATINGVTEQAQFCFPCAAIEPLLTKLNADPYNYTNPANAPAVQPTAWSSVYDELSIKVTAELPDVELTARQLSNLKPGDFIPISPEANGRVQLLLESAPRFVGNLGLAGEQLAVQISQTLIGVKIS